MYAGDYITLDFTAKEESGAALNLTGLTLKWSLGRTSDGPPLLTKTIGSGITVTDAAAGKFKVELDQADTQKFSGAYYHEAKAFNVSRPYTIFTGQITFETTLIH